MAMLVSPANSERRMANDGISAFVLAGGRSSRMGEDKALLTFGDRNLLQRMLDVVTPVAASVRIVGATERYGSFGNVVEDIYPGCGPLGGIHSALTSSRTELNLIVSVDMPLMTAGFLRWLVVQAGAASEFVVVPDAAGGLQPLCAVYHAKVAGAAEELLKSGDYKVGRLFSLVPTRIISEDQIVAAGFSPEIFRNVNTPEEYAQCRP
jgi:molybdopterin-guanine dinucleotide biosynthesis protein A